MKKIKIALCVAAGVIILATAVHLMLPWVAGFFAVTNDDLLLREAWNNPHIESGYTNWHEVSVAEGMTFMLPSDELLTADDAALTILDADGGAVARGYVQTGGFDQQAADAVMEALAGFPVEETAYDAVPEFIQAHGCAMLRVTVCGGVERASFFQLCLPRGERTIRLYFPDCKGAAFNALIDRVEAMAYSFLYGGG